MPNVHTMLTDYTEAKEASVLTPTRPLKKKTIQSAKYHTKDLIFILVVSLAFNG